MTEICLVKILANTLWLHLNQKNRPLKYLLKRARKNKSLFGTLLQRHREETLEGSIRNSSSTKDMRNLGKKIFHQNYRAATGRSNGFQGKNKHKANLLQHVFSTWNSTLRSEECLSMDKTLVLCKNSSKRAIKRTCKPFFESTGDTYKGPRNFRNCKAIQDTFSKKSNTG